MFYSSQRLEKFCILIAQKNQLNVNLVIQKYIKF